jgi:hypothetical protein
MRKEPSEGDILRNAAFASLEGRALTPQAKKLVAEINTRVVGQLTLDESKPGAVKTNRKMLKAATEAFVADLLTAHSGKRPRRWVYRAMTARGFTGAPVGFLARAYCLDTMLHRLNRRKTTTMYPGRFNENQ